MATETAVDSGLEGVVVARTALSCVDGVGGRLLVRGHDVGELAERASFEQVCGLLWEGFDPAAATHRVYAERLAAARAAAYARLPELSFALRKQSGMDALRAAIAQLDSDEPGDPVEQAFAITGAAAVFAAAASRARRGLPARAPDPALDHASDYLQMTTGSSDAGAARALGRYLVTVAEHGMNASTFAARVVASTGSDLVSAVVAAIGALKGPLHGGAPGPVLDMLDAIGADGDARVWLEAQLREGRRIMGMGHRVYRVRDPRADVLEAATRQLSLHGPGHGRLAVARRVEQAARELLRERHPGRSLDVNVEFYTAVLLDAVGLDREDFTPTFALARCAGWCGHVFEQRETGRLIRPAVDYIGPTPELAA